LVVNGQQPPRAPREFRRRLRAAIHNRAMGKPSADGETLSTLVGMAAYVYMSDPKRGKRYLDALAELDRLSATRPPSGV
jgi:hypothetical protein